MLTVQTAVDIGGNATDGVIAHVGDDRIGIRGAVCPSDQTTRTLQTPRITPS
jgi:hypothetical protein